jgi:small subunit ribosomal protein S4
MARYCDSVCKLCRREGMKLFLKGSRCDSPKCPIEKQRPAPGMHGMRRGKPTEYGIRLREKQKLKRFYGVLERQFRRYLELASRSPENTGEMLLTIMERRLDNVVYRLGFATSRNAARQLVTHGHILLNGQYCNIPSLLLKANDKIGVKNVARSQTQVRLAIQTPGSNPPIPDYLERSSTEPPEGRVSRLPSRDDVDPHIKEIREHLIIELATR